MRFRIPLYVRRTWTRATAALTSALMLVAAGCASTTAPSAPPVAPAAQASPAAGTTAHVFGNVPVRFRYDAKEAYLVNNHTGTVLYELNSNDRIQPGSLAKLMTFYIALNALRAKQVSLDSKAIIGPDVGIVAKNQTLSRMYLKVGQTVSLEDLLYGMMVHSGCDAALAIADVLSGDSRTFVAQMNSEAARLGMTNTNFTEPNGIPEPGEYTTAHDMAVLAQAVIREHPEATKYTSQHYFKFNGVRQQNTNGLLFLDTRVAGLKTGHVQAAGFHVVAFASTANDEFICAVMGAPSDFRRTNDGELLLDWAFSNFGTASHQRDAALSTDASTTPGRAE